MPHGHNSGTLGTQGLQVVGRCGGLGSGSGLCFAGRALQHLFPVVAPELARVGRAVGAIAAAQVIGRAIQIAAPAQALGVGGGNREFFGHLCASISVGAHYKACLQFTPKRRARSL